MSRAPRTDSRSFFTFVKKGITDFHQTASIVPSQRFLVNAMVDAAAPERAHTIVELGPGTGPMTGPLLSRMRKDARLFTIEIDQPLHEELVRTHDDPRLTAILGSAEHIEELLAERGHTGKVDVVFSSLGMSLIPPSVRERILESAARVLAPGGTYVQFGYFHTRYVTWTKDEGLKGFNYFSTLKRHFGKVTRKPVPANFPPAWVYRAHPRTVAP
jgi:phosphatidylethanolamine/phosphatidyl-N-methylethanolamine N-methyltransferase